MSDSALATASAQVREARCEAPVIKAFFDEPTFTVSYVVHDPQTLRAAIVDSVLDYDPASGRTSRVSADAIIAYARENALSVDWLLETHAHADHLSAAHYLQKELGGKIAIGGGAGGIIVLILALLFGGGAVCRVGRNRDAFRGSPSRSQSRKRRGTIRVRRRC